MHRNLARTRGVFQNFRHFTLNLHEIEACSSCKHDPIFPVLATRQVSPTESRKQLIEVKILDLGPINRDNR